MPIEQTTLIMGDNEFTEMKAFVQGYIGALVTHEKVYEGFDEFYSYNDKWDINIHANGKPRTIYATAYAQTVDADGYLHTDMSNWVQIGQFDFQGTPKRKATPQ